MGVRADPKSLFRLAELKDLTFGAAGIVSRTNALYQSWPRIDGGVHESPGPGESGSRGFLLPFKPMNEGPAGDSRFRWNWSTARTRNVQKGQRISTNWARKSREGHRKTSRKDFALFSRLVHLLVWLRRNRSVKGPEERIISHHIVTQTDRESNVIVEMIEYEGSK